MTTTIIDEEEDFELDEYIRPAGGSPPQRRVEQAPQRRRRRRRRRVHGRRRRRVAQPGHVVQGEAGSDGALGELPEDKQARVVQIVAERHAELGGNEDDLIEINIEELDAVTLWKLDRYVRSCLKPKKKKQTRRRARRRSAWRRRRSVS